MTRWNRWNRWNKKQEIKREKKEKRIKGYNKITEERRISKGINEEKKSKKKEYWTASGLPASVWTGYGSGGCAEEIRKKGKKRGMKEKGVTVV